LILPTKRLPEDRALLAIGADVLLLLYRPQTVSKLWGDLKSRRQNRIASSPLPFDWFVLSLSFLFAIGAVELQDGRLRRVSR
jgi:hypothetical protein